ELIRSRVPLFCFGRQPATQVLSASTFINQNAFYAPLVQIVPPEVTNAQAKGVADTTSTEIKGVLQGDRAQRRFQKRAAWLQPGRADDDLHARRQGHADPGGSIEEKQAGPSRGQQTKKQRWQKMADTLGVASKKEAADLISKRTGTKFSTVYRGILNKR